MTRLLALTLAALIVATPLSVAAQDRGGFRDDRSSDRGQVRERRQMSVAEAQAIARGRAGGAAFKGYLGMRGSSHVFRFEDNGRVFDIAVDAGG